MVLYFGGKLVLNGDMQSGNLMTFLVACQQTQRSLQSLGVLFGFIPSMFFDILGQSIKATASVDRIFEFMPEVSDVSERVEIPNWNGELVLEDISFAYPTRLEHAVLDSFSLRIPNGSKIALV